MENGLLRLSSRDVSENSNARVVPRASGSGFIALIEPATEEMFSADLRSQPRNAAVSRERLRADVNALLGDEKRS
jgi:hypothetical protein